MSQEMPERGDSSDTPEKAGSESHELESGPAMHHHRAFASTSLSHSMAPDDPANPLNWTLHRKVFASMQAWLYAFVVAVGLTFFAAAKMPIVQHFDINSPTAVEFTAAFSLYLFGIAFAPIWVPHVTERIGRSSSYAIYILLNGLFNMGVGLSPTMSGVYACRFFAGFFGGPCLVLLEGSFADVWSAETTNTYYAVQGMASFSGALFAPLFAAYIIGASDDWRYAGFFPAALALLALVFGFSMPETYQREIPRRLGKAKNRTRREIIASQSPAQSGETFVEMAKVTVTGPLVLFLSQPIVTIVTIVMFVDWLLTFQWFISVPVALGSAPPAGYGFTGLGIGEAVLGSFAGAFLGALSVIITEAVTNTIKRKRIAQKPESEDEYLELRLVPAIIGAVFISVALFWVANTTGNPQNAVSAPVAGVAFFVWGSAMITFSVIPYTFDLFSPSATLGAITSQAVGRILAAAFLPFLILQAIDTLKPKWAFGLFGFLTLALVPLLLILFIRGAHWRLNSKYAATG